MQTPLIEAQTILHNEWDLSYDEFSHRIVLHSPPPRFRYPLTKKDCGWWTDDTTTAATLYLEDKHRMSLSRVSVYEAARAAARRRRVHPIRDWMEGLKWDGVKRLDDWLIKHAGAEDNDYTKAVFSKWMISAVARIYEPGCQVDHVLILEGEKGIGKTSLFRILGGPYYLSLDGDLNDKDTKQRLFGKHIVELSELSALKRTSQIEAVKSFVTTPIDSFRVAYGRGSEDFPRQCVLGGSTNATEWMREDSERRWWPVGVEKIDLQNLETERNQLFGEAVVRYRTSEPYHLVDPKIIALATVEVENRREVDMWEEIVEKHLVTQNRGRTTIRELLHLVGADQSHRLNQMRMSSVLKILGWRRIRENNQGVRKWVYVPNSNKGLYGLYGPNLKQQDSVASTNVVSIFRDTLGPGDNNE